MIITPFKARFEQLKRNGSHIQYVLDIGAYRGDFTDTILSVWPTAIVRQIEADERQASWLKQPALIALLGDKEQDSVDYYTLASDKITTGSSIFKETTSHYNAASTIVLKKPMTTIDLLDIKYNFYGDWKNHGLIKIDTQGSELLILRGAEKFLTSKQPRYILLECSVLQYNQNSPLIAEVMETMQKLNYYMADVFDTSYTQTGQLLQIDILFERKN
jgi:FkbM family methyltransferase